MLEPKQVGLQVFIQAVFFTLEQAK